MIRLHAVGGLCNRLRAILSWTRPLTVIWEPDEYVSFGRFDEVFGPLDGVDFVYRAEPWDVEAWAPMPGAREGWQEAYRELRPLGRWARIPVPYIACHVRRTDHVPNVDTHGGRVEGLAPFVEWSDDALRWADPVYLATDNGETQAEARAVWGGRLLVHAVLGGTDAQAATDHRRNGTLAHAVADLYACAGATEFRGSVGSSFTETIHVLRRLRGVT